MSTSSTSTGSSLFAKYPQQLPGEVVHDALSVPNQLELPDGTMWKRGDFLSREDALVLIQEGADLWCIDEGSWTPLVVGHPFSQTGSGRIDRTRRWI